MHRLKHVRNGVSNNGRLHVPVEQYHRQWHRLNVHSQPKLKRRRELRVRKYIDVHKPNNAVAPQTSSNLIVLQCCAMPTRLDSKVDNNNRYCSHHLVERLLHKPLQTQSGAHAHTECERTGAPCACPGT